MACEATVNPTLSAFAISLTLYDPVALWFEYALHHHHRQCINKA